MEPEAKFSVSLTGSQFKLLRKILNKRCIDLRIHSLPEDGDELVELYKIDEELVQITRML